VAGYSFAQGNLYLLFCWRGLSQQAQRFQAALRAHRYSDKWDWKTTSSTGVLDNRGCNAGLGRYESGRMAKLSISRPAREIVKTAPKRHPVKKVCSG
jgi:hypothetical protein